MRPIIADQRPVMKKSPETVEMSSVRRIGIDVGGTFTDVVMVDDERAGLVDQGAHHAQGPGAGAMEGYRHVLEISGSASRQRLVSRTWHHHGHQHGGRRDRRKTALITTRGFRDILGIAACLTP